MAPVPPSLEDRALRLYRGFLFLYPAEFRREYGRELCLVFTDRWREERSFAALLRVWLEAVSGVLNEAPKEHLHMILQDLRYALRVLRQDAAVTAAAVAILALGIGATTLVFSLANGLLLRPLPYPRQDRIVAVEEYSPKDPSEHGRVPFPNYSDMRARTRLLADLGVYSSDEFSILGEGAAEVVPGAQVSDGIFPVLGTAPLLGRVFTRAEDQPHGPKVVVLGAGLWRRRYGGDPGILGKQVQIGASRYAVVGVMPEGFHFPDRAELWLPCQLDAARTPRTDYFLHAAGRLKPGVSLDQANAELQTLLQQIHRENPLADNHWLARATPLREYLAGSYRRAVLTLLVAVGLLLLIACANVSNLLLVKASARVREMAVRSALGASRRRLIRQLISESAVLGAGGGILGVLLACLGIPALLALIPVDLPRWMDFSVDYRVLGFALAASLLTTACFGIAPAFSSSGGDLTQALKEGLRGGHGLRQKLLRHGLVVAEVALSVTLLAGAGLMCRSFLALRAQTMGYDAASVLSVGITYPETRFPDGPAARALLHRLTAEVSSLPGVTAVAFASGVPLADGWGRLVTIEGRPLALQDIPFINHIVVTPGYFHTLGIPRLQGRDFAAADFDAPHVVIVSASFARQHWPHGSAIGKRIRFGPPKNNEPWHTIVGVVADSRHGQLKGEDRANVYLPYSREITPATLVVRAAGDPLRLAPALRARVLGVDREIATSSALSLDQLVGRASWRDRFFTVLFAAFAVIALLLAAVGLYAVLSYAVSLRSQEIGVRMALGASAARVRRMVLRQGLALAGTGLVIGLAAALALTRLLESQLYEVSPMDPASYVAATALLLLVALLAAFVPTRRATSIDPAIALRHG